MYYSIDDPSCRSHYEYDFREVARGESDSGVQAALGLTLHECGLCVLHGLPVNGVRYKYVHFAAAHLPPILFDLGAYLG